MMENHEGAYEVSIIYAIHILKWIELQISDF